MSSVFYMLTTPKFFLLAQTSPLNFRIVYPQIKLVQRDHLISTSSLCPPLSSLSHMGKRHFHPPSCSSEGPNSHLGFTLFFTLSIESANKTSLVHFQVESNHFSASSLSHASPSHHLFSRKHLPSHLFCVNQIVSLSC